MFLRFALCNKPAYKAIIMTLIYKSIAFRPQEGQWKPAPDPVQIIHRTYSGRSIATASGIYSGRRFHRLAFFLDQTEASTKYEEIPSQARWSLPPTDKV